jgi:hypothetical protein
MLLPACVLPFPASPTKSGLAHVTRSAGASAALVGARPVLADTGPRPTEPAPRSPSPPELAQCPSRSARALLLLPPLAETRKKLHRIWLGERGGGLGVRSGLSPPPPMRLPHGDWTWGWGVGEERKKERNGKKKGKRKKERRKKNRGKELSIF